MTADELRKKFREFFEKRDHSWIPSASLVPENDPSVLFTTAGMQPLAPYLLGENHPKGHRLANIQKCLRTNDIDRVGDTYHHTFFEMMGNWSLGDSASKDDIGKNGYWKKEAIGWSFEFLTSKKWLAIPKQKIAVSVFAGDKDAPFDKESYNIWLNLGVPEKRIIKLPKKNNWWGQVLGPCGPNTEMFFWTGKGIVPEVFDYQDKRWVEIWNNVFMEFNRKVKECDEDGNPIDYYFDRLSQKNVDTGIGLERTLALLNGFDDDYRTELFWPIIQKIEELSGKKYQENKKAFRVIADHMRAIIFIILNGVIPYNKDRGSVLRKLIRNAEDKAIELNYKEPLFLNKIAQTMCINYKITDVKFKKIVQILNNELSLKKIYSEAIMPKINKRMRILERYINKELDLKEGADCKWLKAAFINPDKDNGSIAAGKFAYHLYNTNRLLKDKFWELLDDTLKVVINKQDFEKGYILGEEKFKEISRVGAEKKFKGGLADNKVETTRLHTAAHLLLAALKQVLASNIEQKGSNITEEKLRFDFNWPEKLSPKQISEIENLINEKIGENLSIKMEEMPLKEAKKIGAHGIFLDRYGDRVKVYTIGDGDQIFSREICGGPHVKSLSELGHFKITKEESSSAGIRRIKAILE